MPIFGKKSSFLCTRAAGVCPRADGKCQWNAPCITSFIGYLGVLGTVTVSLLVIVYDAHMGGSTFQAGMKSFMGVGSATFEKLGTATVPWLIMIPVGLAVVGASPSICANNNGCEATLKVGCLILGLAAVVFAPTIHQALSLELQHMTNAFLRELTVVGETGAMVVGSTALCTYAFAAEKPKDESSPASSFTQDAHPNAVSFDFTISTASHKSGGARRPIPSDLPPRVARTTAPAEAGETANTVQKHHPAVRGGWFKTACKFSGQDVQVEPDAKKCACGTKYIYMSFPVRRRLAQLYNLLENVMET